MCNFVNPLTNKRCGFKPNMEWCGHHSSRNTMKITAQLSLQSSVEQRAKEEVCEVQQGLNRLSISLTTPCSSLVYGVNNSEFLLKDSSPVLSATKLNRLVNQDENEPSSVSPRYSSGSPTSTSRCVKNINIKLQKYIYSPHSSDSNRMTNPSSENIACKPQLKTPRQENPRCVSHHPTLVCKANNLCPCAKHNEFSEKENYLATANNSNEHFSPYFPKEKNSDLLCKSDCIQNQKKKDLRSRSEPCVPRYTTEANLAGSADFAMQNISPSEKNFIDQENNEEINNISEEDSENDSVYEVNNPMSSSSFSLSRGERQGFCEAKTSNRRMDNRRTTESIVDIDKVNKNKLIKFAKIYIENTKNNLERLEDIIDKLSSSS